MKEQTHTVTHKTSSYPTRLITAEEASSSIKGAVTAERIEALADAGYAPHFRIDGGAPLFSITELKSWLADNLVVECAGRKLPDTIRVMYSGDQIGDVFGIPESIRCISYLKDVTGFLSMSGVYFLCSGDEVVYVGQSVNVLSRIPQHTGSKEFDRAYFVPYPPDRLDELEGALIRHLKPRLNARRSGGAIVGPKPENQKEILASLGFDAANDNEVQDAFTSGKAGRASAA